VIIEFSSHALERALERGASPSSFPKTRAAKIARLVEDDEEFHVKTLLYNWICKRLTARSIIVKSVLYAEATESQAKLPKQRRDELQRERRIRRLRKDKPYH
jgi:hypothetical protein